MALVLALLAALGVAELAGVSDFARDGVAFLGGWRWQALTLDGVEAVLVVAGSVWLLSLAQHRLTSQARVLRGAGRGAYCAFMLQAPVLLTLEIAARPLPLPAVG